MSPCALYLLPVSTVVNGIVTMRFKSHYWGLPGGSNGNEFACNAGDLGLILGLGRSPGEGNSYPTPVLFWPGKFHGLYSSWGRKMFIFKEIRKSGKGDIGQATGASIFSKAGDSQVPQW